MNLRQLICHHKYRFNGSIWKCVKCKKEKTGYRPVYWNMLQKAYLEDTISMLSEERIFLYDIEYKNQRSAYLLMLLSLIAITTFFYFLIKHI